MSRVSAGGFVLAGMALALAACGEEEEQPAGGPRPAALEAGLVDGEAASGTSVDIDELRALGYVESAPTDSPDRGAVLLDKQRSWPGYNLYAVARRGFADLVDAEGNVLRQWKAAESPDCDWARCVLLGDGDLVVVGTDAQLPPDGYPLDETRVVRRYSWEGELQWSTRMPSHHDILPLEDGGFLVLSLRYRIIPSIDPDVEVREDCITRLSAAGEVLETHGLHEMLESAQFEFQPVEPATHSGRRQIDLFHANSLSWAAPGSFGDSPHLLVSLRHQDRVLVLDWQRKALVWSWGRRQISGPHCAQQLSNGKVFLFDNGLARGWSRVIEVDPKTRKVAWELKAPDPRMFFTASRGACQRLPNGNTLVTISDAGRAFELTASFEPVWEYRVPYSTSSGGILTTNRVVRLEREFVDRLSREKGE